MMSDMLGNSDTLNSLTSTIVDKIVTNSESDIQQPVDNYEHRIRNLEGDNMKRSFELRSLRKDQSKLSKQHYDLEQYPRRNFIRIYNSSWTERAGEETD